jgi:hypothetical protein
MILFVSHLRLTRYAYPFMSSVFSISVAIFRDVTIGLD